MIELRVVETIEQMNRSRPRSRQADSDLTGELGVRAGHERCHLLVSHLHEIDRVFGALERTHDPVDAIARITVDTLDTPLAEPTHEKVARRLLAPGLHHMTYHTVLRMSTTKRDDAQRVLNA